MRSGSLLTIALSLLLAAGVAYLGNEWLERRLAEHETGAPSPAPAPETAPVVVAAETLPVGAPIEESGVEVIEIPPDAVPEGAFSDPSQVIGKILRQPVYAGEMILPPRLVGDATGSVLSAMIAPGKRAMTVAVNDVSGVAGFATPGSRIDVVATGLGGEPLTVLQNIKVLAAGRSLQPTADGGGTGGGPRALTLEVTPAQAEELAAAASAGGIQLTLRNQSDDATVDLDPGRMAPVGMPLARAETDTGGDGGREPAPQRRELIVIRGTEQCRTRPGSDCR